MAVTESSLYAHYPTSNFSLKVPVSQIWIEPHERTTFHQHNPVNTYSPRESSVSSTDRLFWYPLDLLSSSNKRIKARRILEYIRKIIHQQTLCKRHKQDLDQALAKVQLIYQQSQGDSSRQTDQALVYSFFQLKRITQCCECRGSGKATSDELISCESAPGSRVNHAGLIWALLRNWCDVFRTWRSHPRRTNGATPIDGCKEGGQCQLIGSEPLNSTARYSTERIDKSDYCWQWLLTQTVDSSGGHAENVAECSTQRTPLLPQCSRTRSPSSLSLRSDNRFRTVNQKWTRRHSMSDITVQHLRDATASLKHTEPRFTGNNACIANALVLPIQPVHLRRKFSPILSTRTHMDDDASSLSPIPKASRCFHLPPHVTRRSDTLRSAHRIPKHPLAPVSGEPVPSSIDGSRTFRSSRSPDHPMPTLKVYDSSDLCGSTRYTHHHHHQLQQTQKQGQQQQQQQQQQQLWVQQQWHPHQKPQTHSNLRTINFLQSLSPNMHVVPPPNHNPFVLKPVIH